jgi:hypothetical protein
VVAATATIREFSELTLGRLEKLIDAPVVRDVPSCNLSSYNGAVEADRTWLRRGLGFTSVVVSLHCEVQPVGHFKSLFVSSLI